MCIFFQWNKAAVDRSEYRPPFYEFSFLHLFSDQMMQLERDVPLIELLHDTECRRSLFFFHECDPFRAPYKQQQDC